MRTQSSDTDPKIEQMQIEGFRRMTPEQRFQMAIKLSNSTFAISWRNFKARNPDLDDDALRLKWIALLYGEDLANRVADYLEQRKVR